MSGSDENSNAYEFTVSELANSLKRTVEETYGHVRVRGELGRVTIAKSGHCYLDVKDDKAVINSIVWKGVMGRLSMRPEEGMEVIVEGKLSTYPGRSNYQLIIEKMELAGAGALMALFEKRKKMLAEEGLFDDDRKVELPFLPQTIGVVTSPTGSVIRDILHRISDRFPSHVLVWPVLVQGDKASEQIAGAITGFNHAHDEDGRTFPKPDVLIVARGGGSMEDLWCFNEEIVARAVAISEIPIISAIGHETDWTLIDFVADYRAPTPTGAAEVAVPVLADYLLTVQDYGVRLTRGLRRNVNEKKTALSASKLPRMDVLLGRPRQRLDLARLPRAASLLDMMRQKLLVIGARLPSFGRIMDGPKNRLNLASARLRAEPLKARMTRSHTQINVLGGGADRAVAAYLKSKSDRLAKAAGLLEAYSYQGVLARGYALVRDSQGQVIRSKESVCAGQDVTLTFQDGVRNAVIDENVETELTSSRQSKSKKAVPKSPKTPNQTSETKKTQRELF